MHLGIPFVKGFVLIPALDLLSVFISLDSVLIDFTKELYKFLSDFIERPPWYQHTNLSRHSLVNLGNPCRCCRSKVCVIFRSADPVCA